MEKPPAKRFCVSQKSGIDILSGCHVLRYVQLIQRMDPSNEEWASSQMRDRQDLSLPGLLSSHSRHRKSSPDKTG